MGDNLKTAVIFTANLIEEKNVVFLTPQKIVVGECSDDTSCFYSYLDGEEFINADDAIREEKNVGFYFVRTIGELKEHYGIEDTYELFQSYIDDLYKQVYYYEISEDMDFEDYFLKSCSIEKFNEKFNLKFSYFMDDNEYSEPEEEFVDPLTENFKNIKKVLDENILFQNEAKDELISTLYNNSVNKNSKTNIIISGPTGVGKSAMLKLLSEHSSQPVLYHQYTPSFIYDAEEYLNDLLLQAYYIGLAKEQRDTITIIIDDFDKQCDYCQNLEVIDVIGKFIKNGKRFVPYKAGTRQGLIFDPSCVTFIICGNFDMVKKEKIIPPEFFKEENINYSDIPMTLNESELINSYGFSKELLSTFNKYIDFKSLTLAKTKKILTDSNNSLFRIYCSKLNEQGIKVNISDETIDLICKKVYSKSNNIKNIDTVVGNVFKDIMVETFTLDGSGEITISDKIVADHTQYTLKKGSKK